MTKFLLMTSTIPSNHRAEISMPPANKSLSAPPTGQTQNQKPHGTAQADISIEEEVEKHAPELYSPHATAEQIPDLDAVGEAELKFYQTWGYLSVAQAFTPEETESAKQGLLDLIMGRNPDFKGIHFEAKARDHLDTMGLEDRQDAVRKLSSFINYEQRLQALAFHPSLIAVIERLLGDSPVLFQDMALLKPPLMGREKPWHQDLSYFNYEHTSPVVGVWIALDEATIENGCMQLLPGEHREPILHWKRRDWQICDSEIAGRHSTAAPLLPGGALLFDGLLPHGTPYNSSSRRRRALQFHYIGKNATAIAATQRMAVFGSEGKDVSC